MPALSRFRIPVRYALAALLIVAGVAHLVAPAQLIRMIPPYLPNPMALVILSGVAELAGGIGLLVPRVRRMAAYGLSLMLVCFLPTSFFMALHPADAGMAGIPVLVFWLRIVILPLFIWAIVWCARRD